MFVEILRRLWGPVLLQIFGRGVDVLLDTDEVPLDQVRLARRGHSDRDIGLPHRQIELGIVDDHTDLDLRVEVEKFVHARGQPDRAKRHRRRDFEGAFRPVFRFGD